MMDSGAAAPHTLPPDTGIRKDVVGVLLQPDGHPIYEADTSDMIELPGRYPRLTEHGMTGSLRPSEWLTTPEAIAQVNHCIAFLVSFTPVQKPNASSLSLKLLAQRYGVVDVPEISNGALIAAGLHLHLPHQVFNGPNVTFGISEPERRWVTSDGQKVPGRHSRKPRHWDLFQEYRTRDAIRVG